MDALIQGRLSQEQAQSLVSTFFSKFVTNLLKLRQPDAHGDQLNHFFQTMLDATVTLVREQDAWEMVEVASRILTDSPAYQFYSQPPSAHPGFAGELGSSDSSGDSEVSYGHDDAPDHGESILARFSRSDDLSPLYRSNVDYFSRCGGFDMLIDRLGSSPVLSISAIRILLKPFVKVRCLSGSSSSSSHPPAD